MSDMGLTYALTKTNETKAWFEAPRIYMEPKTTTMRSVDGTTTMHH